MTFCVKLDTRVKFLAQQLSIESTTKQSGWISFRVKIRKWKQQELRNAIRIMRRQKLNSKPSEEANPIDQTIAKILNGEQTLGDVALENALAFGNFYRVLTNSFGMTEKYAIHLTSQWMQLVLTAEHVEYEIYDNGGSDDDALEN
jgi:hypothetical protein